MYDDWGSTMTQQVDLGNMAFRAVYGDKLRRVHSDFPDEAALARFNYDGPGKRRNREPDGTSNAKTMVSGHG